MTSPANALEESLETPGGQSRARSELWLTIREALRGAHSHDYTSGSIGRSIFLLALPMVLEMAMESIFAVVDVFWVAHLGADAVATVGLTESMMAIVYTIAMGLSIGATAMVSRRIGEGDRDGAARTAVQVIALGIIVSLALGLVGGVFADSLLRLMGASPAVVEHGTSFTRVMLGANATVFMLFLINAVLRGSGDAATAMRVLWLANALNIVLGPLFIFGIGPFPKLGVTGAAVATSIGRGVGMLFAFRALVRPGGRITIDRTHVSLDAGVMARLVRLSSTGMFQILIGTSSWVALVRIISSFGSQAVAGYTIAIRIILFALLPAWGLSNAAATLMGQSLGAGKPDRAEQSVWKASMYALVFLGSVGVCFLVLAPAIVSIFTSDAAVSTLAIRGLRTVALGFPFYAFGMVLTQAFNGAGDTRTPTLINLVAFWVTEIPLAWLLAERLDWRSQGVYVSILAAYVGIACASTVLFKRGHWRTMRV